MNEEELGRLVVRLIGDVSQYTAALQKVQSESAAAATKVEAHGKRMEHALHGVGHVAETTVRFFETLGVAAAFRESLEKFEEFEKANIRMEAVLKANQRNVAETMDEYNAFAKEMSNTTTASKGQVRALLEMAETYGLTGKAAEQAAQDALKASAITGKDSETLLRFSQAMAKGDMERAMMFTRMIPQLRGVRNEAELLEKWQRLVAAGGDVMSRQLDTASGQLDKAKQRMAAFSKEVGGAIAMAIEPAAAWLGRLAEKFAGLEPQTRRTVATIVALTASYIALSNVLPILITQFKAIAANPLAWVAAAVGSIVVLAQYMNETSESARRLKEELEGLEKARRGETAATLDATTDFIKANEGNRKALEDQITANQDRLRQLHDQEVAAQAEVDHAQRRAGMEGNKVGPKAQLEWLGRQAGRLVGYDPARLQKEQLKDVLAQIEALRQANDRLTAASAPKTVGGLIPSILPTVLESIKQGVQGLKDLTKAGEDFQKQQEELAESWRQKVMTPLEKYQEQMQQLDNLMYEGAISTDLYDKAVDHLGKELAKTSKQQADLNRLQQDAVEFGSTAAARRGMEYLNVLSGGMLPSAGPGGAVPVQRGPMPVEMRFAPPDVLGMRAPLGRADAPEQLLRDIRDALLNMVGIKIGNTNLRGGL